MTITVDNYLDLGSFITNELIGSIMLTYFIGLILVVVISIKFNAKLESVLGLGVVYTLGFATLFSGSIVLLVLLIIMIIGGIGYLKFGRKVNQ